MPLQKINKFIDHHHTLTLATVDAEGSPYCATVFYAYDPERVEFIFASGLDTAHGSHMVRNARVAASIHLETKVVGKVQGLQIVGSVQAADSAARRRYLVAYPYAVAATDLVLWRLSAKSMKLTDNRLGFGKKLLWNR